MALLFFMSAQGTLKFLWVRYCREHFYLFIMIDWYTRAIVIEMINIELEMMNIEFDDKICVAESFSSNFQKLVTKHTF